MAGGARFQSFTVSKFGNNILDSGYRKGQDQTEWREFCTALAEGNFPWRGEWVIAIVDIVVCADESGIHDGAVVCGLSGYIGSLQQWGKFETAWESVLKKFDVADFHSRDFFAVAPDGRKAGRYCLWSDKKERRSYGNWSDAQYEEFLAALLGVIDQHRVSPLGATVELPAFWKLSYGERRFVTGGHFDSASQKWLTSGAPNKPYFLVFDHCLIHAAEKTDSGKKILFVFDRQKQYESRAIEQFGESARICDRAISSKFAGITYQERQDAPGLQAADLYTHCWHRYLTNPDRRDSRRIAMNTLTRKDRRMKSYTEPFFEQMLSSIPPDVRETIRKTPDPTAKGAGE